MQILYSKVVYTHCKFNINSRTKGMKNSRQTLSQRIPPSSHPTAVPSRILPPHTAILAHPGRSLDWGSPFPRILLVWSVQFLTEKKNEKHTKIWKSYNERTHWLILKFVIILSSTFSLALTCTSVLLNVAKFYYSI